MRTMSTPPSISNVVFVVGWALALIAVGVWAAMVNNRWVINTVALFAGIHLYTQWFERLGATPGTVLLVELVEIPQRNV